MNFGSSLVSTFSQNLVAMGDQTYMIMYLKQLSAADFIPSRSNSLLFFRKKDSNYWDFRSEVLKGNGYYIRVFNILDLWERVNVSVLACERSQKTYLCSAEARKHVLSLYKVVNGGSSELVQFMFTVLATRDLTIERGTVACTSSLYIVVYEWMSEFMFNMLAYKRPYFE